MTAKNAVSETTATTGGAGVGGVITLTGSENGWNPTFLKAYESTAALDIPVTVQAGNDWQACRCNFDGAVSLTVQSIQAQYVGGVYTESGEGITLSGTPIAQVSNNAASFLDSLGAEFKRYAAFSSGTGGWVPNTGTSPTVDLSAGNNQTVTNAVAGAIAITGPPGVVMHATIAVTNPDTITAVTVPGVVKWVGGAVPTWTTNGNEDWLSVVFDGTNATIGVSLDVGAA